MVCFSFFFLKTLIVYFLIAEEARSMLQGVGSRFDFHINKTLCDLRFAYLTILNSLVMLVDSILVQRRFSILSLIFPILWEHFRIFGYCDS